MRTHAVLRIFLLLFILCAFSFVSAQNRQPWSSGGFIGISLANAKVKNDIPGDYHTMYGFNGDGFLEYKFQNKLSIQTQLGILQTGYQNSYRYYLSATIGQELVELESSYSGYDYQIRYVNLINSWFIGYTFGEKYSIKPQIGFFAGVNLANKSEAESYIYIALEDYELINDPDYPPGYMETYEEAEFADGSFTKFQFGIASNLVLGYQINHQYQFFLSSGFYLDLINSAQNPEQTGYEQYFRTFTINIGFAVNLGGDQQQKKPDL